MAADRVATWSNFQRPGPFPHFQTNSVLSLVCPELILILRVMNNDVMGHTMGRKLSYDQIPGALSESTTRTPAWWRMTPRCGPRITHTGSRPSV